MGRDWKTFPTLILQDRGLPAPFGVTTVRLVPPDTAPMKAKPILYVKAGCPWCVKALDFFNEHGVDLDVRDVLRSKDAMARMVAVSGQTKCPTFEMDDFIVADFSVDEFMDALAHQPDSARRLGIDIDEA